MELLEFLEKEPESFGGYLVTMGQEDERYTIDILCTAYSKQAVKLCKDVVEIQPGRKNIHTYWD